MTNTNIFGSDGPAPPWGLDKATLSLCAAKVCKLVLAEVVREEVEENPLLHAEHLPSLDASQLTRGQRERVFQRALPKKPK